MSSAKKYLNLQLVSDIADTSDLLLDEENAAQVLLKRLETFIDALDDDYLNVESWSVFNAWQESSFDRDCKNVNLFRSWQCFQWKPDPATVKHNLFNDSNRTIASVYLKDHVNELSKEELKIVENLSSLRLDLYEIIGIQENYITLYGILHQAKVIVFNTDVSLNVRIGQYIFASVVAVDPLRSIFLGKSRPLPRECHDAISDFQKFVRRCESNPRNFESFESDILNLYYDLSRDYI